MPDAVTNINISRLFLNVFDTLYINSPVVFE